MKVKNGVLDKDSRWGTAEYTLLVVACMEGAVAHGEENCAIKVGQSGDNF